MYGSDHILVFGLIPVCVAENPTAQTEGGYVHSPVVELNGGTRMRWRRACSEFIERHAPSITVP